MVVLLGSLGVVQGRVVGEGWWLIMTFSKIGMEAFKCSHWRIGE